MQPTTEQVQRLMEIALVAAGNGLYADAEAIFTGIQAVRPDSELPLVGRGFLLINVKKYPEAVFQLQQALEKNPDSDLALSFLGAALKLSGLNHAGNEVLEQVVSNGQMEEAIELATAMAQHPG